MLEEQKEMEKKQTTRQSSVPPKTNGSETKKDSGTPKSQKFQRRRGNGGGGNFSCNDGQARKTTPQKYKNSWDKRPKSRAGFSDRSRDDLEDNNLSEYGSEFQSSSRKGNLNHLLNFSYKSHEATQSGYGGFRGGGWGQGRSSHGYRHRGQSRKGGGSTVCYNKEQFLQANCQFVVKDNGDYSVNLMEPDSLVNWDVVEQVRVFGHETSSCPICLQHPVAAKMTRCGHIYCWPCILHYLALGEKSWRKCPICYESIHTSDLKSVVSREVITYKPGDTISMTLMKKVKGSLYAVPSVYWTRREEGICHNVGDQEDLTRHMKLLVATPQQVLKLITEEKQQLQQQLKDAEPSEEAFIDSALSLLKERELLLEGADKIKEELAPVVDRANAAVAYLEHIQQQPVHVTPANLGKNVKVYKSAFSDEEDEVEMETSLTSEENITKREVCEEDCGVDTSIVQEMAEGADVDSKDDDNQSNSPQQVTLPVDMSTQGDPDSFPVGSPAGPEGPLATPLPDSMPVEEAAEHLEMPTQMASSGKTRHKSGDESFYFYQASDGQHIYLHSLNARCLVKEYGSMENSPPVVEATIVEKESIFVTEELRKRLRYLSHLPLTCSFEVAELALKPPVVEKETLKHFAEDIERRKRLRQRKNREDKRWTKKIDQEERKKLGLSTGTIIYSQFNQPKTSAISARQTSLSINPSTMDDTRSDTSSPSLETPIGSPSGWPVTGSDGHEEGDQTAHLSFAQMLKAGKKSSTVWPKVNGPLSPLSPTSRAVRSDESDNEDKIPVPQYQHSFGTAIETALVNMGAKASPGSSDPTSPQKTTGSGKKKKKQLVLFSTSMARGGK